MSKIDRVDFGPEALETPENCATRRRIVQAGLGVGLGVAGLSLLSVLGGLRPQVVQTPENAPPQKGDLLVAAQGSAAPLRPQDIPAGARQLLAWPQAPAGVLRKGSPTNLILLARASSAAWLKSGQNSAAQGVVAYGATCTHLCCTVSDWAGNGAGSYLVCPCHLSHFDPWDAGRVLSGPAPRPLPALPLALDSQGRLTVAADFGAQPGCGS